MRFDCIHMQVIPNSCKFTSKFLQNHCGIREQFPTGLVIPFPYHRHHLVMPIVILFNKWTKIYMFIVVAYYFLFVWHLYALNIFVLWNISTTLDFILTRELSKLRRDGERERNVFYIYWQFMLARFYYLLLFVKV